MNSPRAKRIVATNHRSAGLPATAGRLGRSPHFGIAGNLVAGSASEARPPLLVATTHASVPAWRMQFALAFGLFAWHSEPRAGGPRYGSTRAAEPYDGPPVGRAWARFRRAARLANFLGLGVGSSAYVERHTAPVVGLLPGDFRAVAILAYPGRIRGPRSERRPGGLRYQERMRPLAVTDDPIRRTTGGGAGLRLPL